jgi:hypothetical protein
VVPELIPVGLHSDDGIVNIYSNFRLTWNDWLDSQDSTRDNIKVEPKREFFNFEVKLVPQFCIFFKQKWQKSDQDSRNHMKLEVIQLLL